MSVRASPTPLWCKSCFSFLEGASQPEELVEQAHALGLPGLALTDRDGVYGVVRAHVRARELGVGLAIGAEVSIDDGSKVVLLAQDREGYAELCRLLSQGRLRSEKGKSVVSWAEVCDAPYGMLALWGGDGGARTSDGDLRRLREAFGDRLYALAARHGLAEEVARERALRARAGGLGVPVVASTEVLYHTPGRRRLQDVLTCIRHGVPLHNAGRRLRGNGAHALLAPEAFRARFPDDPAAVARTTEVFSRCAFTLDEIEYRYPTERLPDGTSSGDWLRHLAFCGARWRYGGVVPDAVADQLELELELICELEYAGYFLTMWEIVEFCRAREILCQGRGSAASSVVCYCLGITAVDPVRLDLLFERFISRERREPPDIDLDIAHERREEVIQHVYEKYGRGRAAMVANVVRYRARSAIRDVGRALGIPDTGLDRLAKLCSRYDGLEDEALRQAGLDPEAEAHRHLKALVEEIQGFPRHLSVHPGGFLLGHEPVHRIVPIENATMEGRTVIQWDKDDIEALGLFKVDLLGLGALTVIDGCLSLLKRHKGRALTLAMIPPEDPATYAMICRADTVGVFQIESRAQMAMLPRLLPRTYYDLVVEISLVRPGPIAGDMVHPYLKRRNGLEPVTMPHPCLEPVLARTLGVPLFQEQVMRLAVVAADYTPGEADQLRRDMAAWRQRGRIERHRERLIARMERKGIARPFAERVFEQIRGFGEYGFPESHAASFALLAYATAWLKCHHPEAFTCALLNAQPMGFYAPATIIEDAKRHGVGIRPICVLHSDWDCTLEPEGVGSDERLVLRMGLRYIRWLKEADGCRVALLGRLEPYRDLADFCWRSALGEGQLTTLAEAGALEGLGLSRREALWEVRRLVRERRVLRAGERRLSELGGAGGGDAAPAFAPLDGLEVVAWDHRTSSHSPRGHPLGGMRALLRSHGLPCASELAVRPDRSLVRYAGLVICRQRPATANGVVFMTLEDETGFLNLVLWEKVVQRFAVLARTAPFLGVTGRLQRQDGVLHVVAQSLWEPVLEARPVAVSSRDFH